MTLTYFVWKGVVDCENVMLSAVFSLPDMSVVVGNAQLLTSFPWNAVKDLKFIIFQYCRLTQQTSDLVCIFTTCRMCAAVSQNATNAECGRWDLFQSFVCSLMVANRNPCLSDEETGAGDVY